VLADLENMTLHSEEMIAKKDRKRKRKKILGRSQKCLVLVLLMKGQQWKKSLRELLSPKCWGERFRQ
jgi:hypothetical protein